MSNFTKVNCSGYFFEVHAKYSKMLHGFYDDLLFSPELMKIKKVEKFVGNLYDKREYISHIWNLKKAWNHETILKKNA